MQHHVEVAVIGAGQAGIPLAQTLAAHGQAALVERKHLGGSCVNFGCTPTKAVLASARVAHQARGAHAYGIEVGEVRADFAAVMARARQIVQESRDSLQRSVEATSSLLVLRGHARLAGRAGERFVVQVGERQLLARQVVLNTGTRSQRPAIEGLADIPCLHGGNWLDQDACPEHLVMLGGGAIGVEMSQFYRRMGAQVTLLEGGDQLGGHEDQDVALALQGLLEDEGIGLRFGVRVTRVRAQAGGVLLTLRTPQGDAALSASHLFVATGRRPNTDDLGLESVGVECDEHGFIKVDERLATTVPGIWAAGDIRGGPMFTHTAWDDHRVLLSQLQGDGQRTTRRVVPYGIFTDPPLGRVGLTEAQARQQYGDGVRVSCYDLRRNGKATELGETRGFVKLVLDADSRLLGAAVFGVHGEEVVHAYIDLMNLDLAKASTSLEPLVNAVHIHPTLAEAVQSAARQALEQRDS